MILNQPYYIEKRTGENHIDLNGEWDFFGSEEIFNNAQDIDNTEWQYKTQIPLSVCHALHRAGLKPAPYYGTNSKAFFDVDEKVWYFKKTFILNKTDFSGNAYLCFDGVSYYCKVWLNGTLLGDHEGMFGGPVCDVYDYLNLNGENTIVVEVKSCNFGKKDTFNPWNQDGINEEIVPWNIMRDHLTTPGDFLVVGIWNNVRLELVPKLHISRPYLYTESIEKNSAKLHLELEIADGFLNELHPYFGYTPSDSAYTRAYDNGLTGAIRDENVKITIDLIEPDTSNIVYHSTDDVPLMDFENSGINKKYYELQFFTKNIEVKNPKLWYPTGFGKPYLYAVKLQLFFNGELLDTHDFKTGIRTFTSRPTAGNKYRHRWENFRFSINDRDFFLMGINWMPVDFLYDIDEKEYKWALTLAKNAGVSMLRVWNGGGMPETDTFYELCDEMGIMVWQDHFLANTADTHSFNQEILEYQESYNLYRIRNHASLVMHCGGNEFNPYATGMAASMFITERSIRTLDPSRIFHYTTADKGSAHIYNDMEPVWYRHFYKELPFLAESGIHSFPSYRTLRKLISKKECEGKLPDLTSPEFQTKYPELLNHFTEYIPERIPRMMSRISQVVDITNVTLDELAEASHAQAYEFYTLMIQSMRENYPVCGGILPWVFKRHYPTVGIQMVDGLGQPTYPYYAMKNAYTDINICLCQEWTVIAPFEEIPLQVKILKLQDTPMPPSQIVLTIYNPDLTVAKEYIKDVSPVQDVYDFESFTPEDSFTDTCFLICAELKSRNELISQTVYVEKCISALVDKELYKKCRTPLANNLYFDKAPFLKDCINNAKKASLSYKIISKVSDNGYAKVTVELENTSDIPAYPVTLEPKNPDIRFFCSDNFFMLKPGQTKQVNITGDGIIENINVFAWNV